MIAPPISTAGRAPVAYIRRSISRENDRGDVSREDQTAEVRKLANGDGPALHIIDTDWGRSAGRKAAHLRAGYDGLVAAVERGEVSAVYALSEDRLARDVAAAVRLLNACERNGVPIVCRADRYEPGDARARRRFIDEANDNEYHLSKMTDRASGTAIIRKERGDTMGRAPYGYRHQMVNGVSKLVPHEGEDPQVVVDAFLETGTYGAAASKLNAAGYPTRFARVWDASTVRHVVLRERPELVPVRTHRGAGTRATRYFARLLRCPHADRHPATPFLTSSTAPGGGGRSLTRYYCRTAHVDPTHPRPYIVAERKVLAWAKEELKKLGGRMKVERREPADAKLAVLEARRERIIANYEDGDITREQKRAKLAAIDAEMPALEQGRRAAASWREGTLKPVIRDWDDPAAINAELRNLWQWVEMDPAIMEPVRAVWTVGQDPADEMPDAPLDGGENVPADNG